MTPYLHLITGPMFSGKTTELIRLAKRARIADPGGVACMGPERDERSEGGFESHAGHTLSAGLYSSIKDALEEGTSNRGVKLVVLDELHLFDDVLYPDYVMQLHARGISVLAGGLDLDFAGRPFESIERLLPFADRVTKLTSVCSRCRSEEACRTQRVEGGFELTDGPRILVGGQDHYEPRCLDCFVWPEYVITRKLRDLATPYGGTNGTV